MNRWSDWWRQAQMEQRAATHLHSSGDYAWCCFTCQQAAERALKAVLELRNEDHKGHCINRLLRSVFGIDEPPRTLLQSSARLNRLYIPTRYPDAVVEGAPADQYLEEDSQQALRDLQIVMDYVAAVIGPTAT